MVTDLNNAPDMVYAIAFSPSGDKTVCLHENNTVTAWDTRASDLGLDERPLFATENKKAALGGIRLQQGGRLLTSTGAGNYLKWDASTLRCTGNLLIGGIKPDHWDSSFDGNMYYTSSSNIIRVYNDESNLILSRKLKAGC